jgi:hypothetical protein
VFEGGLAKRIEARRDACGKEAIVQGEYPGRIASLRALHMLNRGIGLIPKTILDVRAIVLAALRQLMNPSARASRGIGFTADL